MGSQKKYFGVWWFCEAIVAYRAERVPDTRKTQFLSKEVPHGTRLLSLQCYCAVFLVAFSAHSGDKGPGPSDTRAPVVRLYLPWCAASAGQAPQEEYDKTAKSGPQPWDTMLVQRVILLPPDVGEGPPLMRRPSANAVAGNGWNGGESQREGSKEA